MQNPGQSIAFCLRKPLTSKFEDSMKERYGYDREVFFSDLDFIQHRYEIKYQNQICERMIDIPDENFLTKEEIIENDKWYEWVNFK